MITSVSLVCPFGIINKTNLLSRNTIESATDDNTHKTDDKIEVCAHKLRICLVKNGFMFLSERISDRD